MTVAPLLLLAVLARASEPPATAANAAVEPVGAPGVAVLKERFLAALDDKERGRLLDAMAATAPTSAQDVTSLFDLFSRFPDPTLRRKVMESLGRLRPDSPQLEPLFVTYLSQDEPEAQLFGVNGAFRLRSRQALPFVRKIAQRKFKAPSPNSVNALSERNAWWTQYEALSALAQWEGEKALPLLKEKTRESPDVARLLGRFFWKKTLPDLKRWAVSSDAADGERAVEAAGAAIAPEEARACRDELLALVRDPKADPEVRHRLALKVGAVSDDAQTEALVKEHDAAADDRSRLIWAAAVFQSPSEKAVPLLARYARSAADEADRRGARAALVGRLGEEKTAALLNDGKGVEK
ncbi:MAG: hypothetical protein HY079_07215 [Elusimicrobia bacterium]|nr:hypothetical protein [Elusimicrobiota bacterium]